VNLFGSGSIPLGHLLITTLQACSWESSQPPKLIDGVRILTLVLAWKKGSGTEWHGNFYKSLRAKMI
jgi:hypothetical protein